MSRPRQSGALVARIAAMDEYIAALLDDVRRADGDAPEAAIADASEDQSALPPYRVFSVAGMKMLVPEGELAECGPLPDIRQQGAGPAWQLGCVLRGGEPEVVVDLAKVVAPGLGFAPPVAALRLAGRAWWLAVAEVGEVVEIEDTQFAWRADRSSRPWLAGMTRDTPRALIDLDVLLQTLLTELQS